MEECMDSGDPTWLEKRRAEQGPRFTPLPSRDWKDDEVHGLTRDVAFNRHSMNDGHHVSPTDNAEMQVGTDNIRVALAQGIDEEAFKRTLTAATRATIGLDMTQTLPGEWERCKDIENEILSRKMAGKDWQEYSLPKCGKHSSHEIKATSSTTRVIGQVPMEDWEEMLKGGLQTALETQTIVFAVGGVSRTATHQLVRSRRAAFHQQSQRASYMGDCPEVRIPESIWVNKVARDAFLRAIMTSWNAYRTICEQDISYQDARFVLPEGTTNFILLEYPVREFLNVYAYRACSMFQWEIVHVMRECRRVLLEAHPWLEPYVKISCEKTGPAVIPLTHVRHCICGESEMINADCEIHGPAATLGQTTETVEHLCTFQGWEDVEGQCDFPWAKHEARTFKPSFHRISKKGGE
jgi:flavin-dependent thymidylate synthase